MGAADAPTHRARRPTYGAIPTPRWRRPSIRVTPSSARSLRRSERRRRRLERRPSTVGAPPLTIGALTPQGGKHCPLLGADIGGGRGVGAPLIHRS